MANNRYPTLVFTIKATYSTYVHADTCTRAPCLYWCVWLCMCILACPLICICHCSYKKSCTCVLPVAISCGPAPDAPANGQRSGSGTTVGSTVTYTCNPGYTLQRDNRRTCMANGHWSGRAPTCDRKLLCKHYVCSTIDIIIWPLLPAKVH